MEAVSKHIIDFVTTTTFDDYQVEEWSNGNGYGEGLGCGRACGWNVKDGIGITVSTGDEDSLRGITSFEGHPVYNLENVPTIIRGVVGNAAYGAVLKQDMTLENCCIARYGDSFGHAEHTKAAYEKAKETSIKKGWEHFEKDPITFMKQNYPDVDAPIDSHVLFELHNILTGSCLEGREDFIRDNNIDLDKQLTIREFLKLCKYTYGREVMAKVAEAYGITI